MINWYDTASLPKFESPPVVETAMAIEFAPIPSMDFFKLSRLQSQWDENYPDISEVPGMPPTPPISDGQMLMAFNMTGAGLHRIWAAGRENGLLIQSQNDRLILNWRKVFSSTGYPGYLEKLRPEFVLLWGNLLEFLASVGLPAPIPVLAEFNYVNAVPLDSDDTMQDVVTVVRTPELELPGHDRFARFQIIRDVEESATDPYTSQIHLSGEPQLLPDGNRQLIFTVTARTIVGPKIDDPIAAIDAAHALASNTFARIITDTKKKQWGHRA